jgi:hypothetical protein
MLDYGQTHPFGEIFGRERYLAWPVHAYRVTLPKSPDSQNGLNPFERVVLALLDVAGIEDPHSLAHETRIPEDLIKGILLRLRDKGFIDQYGGVAKLEQAVSEQDKDTVYGTAIIFRELATGKLLPFLHLLDAMNPLQISADPKVSTRIRWNHALEESPPAARDVVRAYRAMKNRSDAFGVVSSMPPVLRITIAQSPELYFLECPIAIQKYDGEFRIADPFGNGFSLILESAFETLLEQDEGLSEWLHKWKQSLSNPIPQSPSDSDLRVKEPFENARNWQRYPKLIHSLRPSKRERFRSIAKIHASLEWALFYACSRRSFENAIVELKFTKQSEHVQLLHNAARNIGLESHEYHFRPIRDGKLLDFQNGKAELNTVLAISILQARQDHSHPIYHLAAAHPGIMTWFLSIKKKRDEIAHGKGKAAARECELSDDPLMQEVVHSLVPDISFHDIPIVTEADNDLQADALLDARSTVQSEFSFKTFNRLGLNLQNRLIHAERFWLSCKEEYEDARSFADDVYAAVQSAFDTCLAGRLPPEVNDTEFIAGAEKKTADAGLSPTLPDSLRTVKTLAIRQTLQGAGPTLGACAIAFLLMSDDDTLRVIADSQPSFINDIDTILTRRGHGNEPLRLPTTEIKRLRKAAYSTIKTLIEA